MTHQHAEVSGEGRSIQAGRDIHIHHGDGVRRTASPTTTGECPYPGLAAFTTEQAGWFFGRDTLTAHLVGRLADRLTEGTAVLVVGPSGAGKSSLLRAGLLAAIADRGALPVPGSRDWRQAVLTPTAAPLTTLAAGGAAVVYGLRIEAARPLPRPSDPPRGGVERDPAMLFRGNRLDAARTWARSAGLSPTGAEFFAASVRQDTRARRKRRTLVAILAVLTLVAATTAGVALDQRRDAAARRRAERRHDPTLAPDRSDPACRDDRRQCRPRRIRARTSVHPDGRLLAAASNDDETVNLWNITRTTEPEKIRAPRDYDPPCSWLPGHR